MKIAVIGGGINGIMSAWALAQEGYTVQLFEKNTIMSQTSSASSKLLHGGLRYLENLEFRLVREGLQERKWWIDQAPHLAYPLRIYIPIYKDSRRPSWMFRIALKFYDILSGSKKLGKTKSYTSSEMSKECPSLKSDGLKCGFSFVDGQMDDKVLGLWAADRCMRDGVIIHENSTVEKVDGDGNLWIDGEHKHFDRIINIAGPWVESLLKESGIKSKHELDLVRGSHIVIEGKLSHGYLLEVPHEDRIFFVLPYQGQTLIGTTEVRQEINEPIKVSEDEINYLICAYNHYFESPISSHDIVKRFSGIRPLIKSSIDPTYATREYEIETYGSLTSVFGGKWTTARQLGKTVVRSIGYPILNIST
jgi:glycerol-3-phosphate dehydrogenase